MEYRCSGEEINDVMQKVKLNKLFSLREERTYSIVNQEIFEMSVGEKARLGLARALVSLVQIILIDEVLSSLDSETSKEIENFILDQVIEFKKS